MAWKRRIRTENGYPYGRSAREYFGDPEPTALGKQRRKVHEAHHGVEFYHHLTPEQRIINRLSLSDDFRKQKYGFTDNSFRAAEPLTGAAEYLRELSPEEQIKYEKMIRSRLQRIRKKARSALESGNSELAKYKARILKDYDYTTYAMGVLNDVTWELDGLRQKKKSNLESATSVVTIIGIVGGVALLLGNSIQLSPGVNSANWQLWG
jgi:hypothetical protein